MRDTRPSLAWLLVSGVGGALATLVVAGVLAARLGVLLVGPLLPGAALIGALPQLLTIIRGRWEARWPVLVAVVIALVAVGGAGLALAWPALLPLGLSVDAVHHTQLVDWIAAHRNLPRPGGDLAGLLGEMVAYPVGLALVVVAAADVAGQPPLAALYPIAALLGGLIAALVVLLSSPDTLTASKNDNQEAGRGPNRRSFLNSQFSILNSLMVPLLLLAHRTYMMEAYTDHSYYTMVLGVLLALLAVAWLVVEPRRSWGAAAQFGVVLGALMCTYPLWAPLPAALAVMVVFSPAIRRAMGEGRYGRQWAMGDGRWAAAQSSIVYRLSSKKPDTDFEKAVLARTPFPSKLAAAGLRCVLMFVPALMLALLDVLPRMRTGQTVLAHEGLVTLPDAQRLMPLLLALPCLPLVARLPRGRWLVAIAALTGLEMAGLALAARAGLAAGYHSYKLLFVLTPLAVAIVGAAVTQIAAQALEGQIAFPHLPIAGGARRSALGIVAPPFTEPAQRMAALGLIALTLAGTGSFQVIPPPAIQTLAPDVVAAARWLRANSPQDAARAIAVGVPQGPASYWVQVGLLGQRRDRADLAMRGFRITPPSPESWLVDPQLPPIAIVPRLGDPLPGMQVVARFGDAAVVRRAAKIDTVALNPLSIRYETFWDEGRIKTAIELRRALPGPLPALEICLYHDGAPVSVFTLQPEDERTRPQYLGVDLLPATLGGEGYVNTSAYPTFATPTVAPTGAFSLTLRLALGGNMLDERALASFERTADGQIERFAPLGGELIYLRRDGEELLGDDSHRLHEAALDFERALQLSGWRAPDRARPGEQVDLALRWQAPRATDRALFPEILLLDAQGRPVAVSLAAPQYGFYPTWRWRAGEVVADQRAIQLPPDMPPGVYRVALRVHDFAAQRALRAGAAGVDVALLGEIVVDP